MWRNAETAEFIEGLRHHNATLSRGRRAGFYGLDLYSLFASLDGVLRWLDESAPDVAARARERYACLAAWEESPQSYGRAATLGATEQCEEKAVAMLRELLARRLEIAGGDDAGFFDALMNARLIANAERYYRAMFGGAVDSWNVRDTHMMETLEALLERNGPDARAVVWAHNSHVGDARATWQGAHGEINIGQLARERFPGETFSLGMFTHAGTVAAASRWDGALEMKRVQPSRPDSYEHAFHDVGHAAFCLPMRDADARVRAALAVERLQRAIGVIYRPETERQSHYFEGCLPAQFDEVVFLDETQAVTPLDSPDRLVGAHERAPELPATFPSGL
jgi:protein-L-isoaspartate(D-aspartate) O-methyltransferase